MSRIAGLIVNSRNSDVHQWVHDMLLPMRQTNWQSDVCSKGQAVFGWTGGHAVNMTCNEELAVVMDGFVYNREDWTFQGSDAQIILELYQKYGFEGVLQRINGDFSIALYDGNKKTFWLGRDRFGIKPLYYVAKHNFFAFASRPKVLLTLPGISRDVNRQFVALFATCHYRYFDNFPETTPYAEISQLPACHILCVKNGQISKFVYWSLTDQDDLSLPEKTLAEHYRELLYDSVSLRLKSSKRPAFTLSGGMDSSSVLATAVRLTGEKQHAFSTVYDDSTYDESEEIKPILDSTVKEWHQLQIGNPDVFEIVRRMIDVHDEPVATATWLSHFLLCDEASKQGFGSLFGGLGGDELNAGEYEHFFYYFADLCFQGDHAALAHEVSRWSRYHDHPIYKKNMAVVEESLGRMVDLRQAGRCLPDRRRLERYFGALNPDYFDILSFEPTMDHPFHSYLKNRTYQDIFSETAPCCLRAEDRQTTAFNLENFLPFFDHRLVEFMFRVPGKYKIRDGITKRLLRQAMKGILPEETRTRIKKTGWNAPAHVWFSGKGLEELQHMVQSKSFKEHGAYNVPVVQRLIDEHRDIVSTGAAKENHMMFFWQMINLEIWLSSLD